MNLMIYIGILFAAVLLAIEVAFAMIYNLKTDKNDENTENVSAVWNWINKKEVRCSNCNSIVGVAFSEGAYEELASENKYCYNCGLKMFIGEVIYE